MSATFSISRSASRRSAWRSPSPSMSIAPRETKCLSSCHWRPWHSRFGHFVNTPSAGLTVGVSQEGQRSGGEGGEDRSERSTACGAGESTCGITSPARRTMTSSPGRMSLRARSSSLCSVASLTVTPPTWTGSSTANGCRSPNLPTFHMMSRSVVTFVVGGNFQAIAQRGSRPTVPRRRCSSRSDTLTTTPSISKSSAPRRCCQASHCATTSSSLRSSLTSALTRRPCSRSHCSPSQWLEKRTPSTRPIP